MKANIYIRLKALFLLIIFSANISAVCHCNHNLSASCAGKDKKDCCGFFLKNQQNPCKEKSNCPCEKKIIKFYQLEKLASEKGLFTTAFIFIPYQYHYNTTAVTVCSTKQVNCFKDKSDCFIPPDYCILYQVFTI